MLETILEAATVAEEVAATGETAVPADLLATVSQQFDQIVLLQLVQVLCLGLIVGAIVGVAVAKVIGRLWR